jgi:hypothetical protein
MAIAVYGCATPIRMHVARAMATYLKCPLYEEGKPSYRGGDSIVWGLIRGSPAVIEATKAAGCNYYQLDNGYFGRNSYYRFTKNAFQQTTLKERKPDRWEHIKKHHSLELKPWKKDGSKVLFCLSTEHLYRFLGLDIAVYRTKTLRRLKEVTQREIVVREKDAVGPIEDALKDAWCVVTHTSAVALDALRFGVPVFTTGLNAADPCALKDVTYLDTPIYPEREPLFWSLAYSQWLPEEMQLGRAWNECLESSSATTV